MIADDHMQAGIEVTALQMYKGIHSHWLDVIVETVEAIEAGGGEVGWHYLPDRDARKYTLVGPPDLVNPAVSAFMAFIQEQS